MLARGNADLVWPFPSIGAEPQIIPAADCANLQAELCPEWAACRLLPPAQRAAAHGCVCTVLANQSHAAAASVLQPGGGAALCRAPHSHWGGEPGEPLVPLILHNIYFMDSLGVFFGMLLKMAEEELL